MKHSEFIEKIKTSSANSRYYQRHHCEPVCDWLGGLRHQRVLQLSALVPLSSKQEMQKALIEKFGVRYDGPVQKWPNGITKMAARQLLKASGLRWFELEGVPYVHWNEKKTETLR